MLGAVPDLIGRKLIAPKMKTQAEMNVFFQGAMWNLAERYTDMVRATHPPVLAWPFSFNIFVWLYKVLLEALLWAVGNGEASNSTQLESKLGSVLGIGTRKLDLAP